MLLEDWLGTFFSYFFYFCNLITKMFGTVPVSSFLWRQNALPHESSHSDNAIDRRGHRNMSATKKLESKLPKITELRLRLIFCANCFHGVYPTVKFDFHTKVWKNWLSLHILIDHSINKWHLPLPHPARHLLAALEKPDVLHLEERPCIEERRFNNCHRKKRNKRKESKTRINFIFRSVYFLSVLYSEG